MRDKVLTNVISYYPYQVQEGERPDTLAHMYYGSVDFMWLILYANNLPLFLHYLHAHILCNYMDC